MPKNTAINIRSVSGVVVDEQMRPQPLSNQAETNDAIKKLAQKFIKQNGELINEVLDRIVTPGEAAEYEIECFDDGYFIKLSNSETRHKIERITTEPSKMLDAVKKVAKVVLPFTSTKCIGMDGETPLYVKCNVEGKRPDNFVYILDENRLPKPYIHNGEQFRLTAIGAGKQIAAGSHVVTIVPDPSALPPFTYQPSLLSPSTKSPYSLYYFSKNPENSVGMEFNPDTALKNEKGEIIGYSAFTMVEGKSGKFVMACNAKGEFIYCDPKEKRIFTKKLEAILFGRMGVNCDQLKTKEQIAAEKELERRQAAERDEEECEPWSPKPSDIHKITCLNPHTNTRTIVKLRSDEITAPDGKPLPRAAALNDALKPDVITWEETDSPGFYRRFINGKTDNGVYEGRDPLKPFIRDDVRNGNKVRVRSFYDPSSYGWGTAEIFEEKAKRTLLSKDERRLQKKCAEQSRSLSPEGVKKRQMEKDSRSSHNADKYNAKTAWYQPPRELTPEHPLVRSTQALAKRRAQRLAKRAAVSQTTASATTEKTNSFWNWLKSLFSKSIAVETSSPQKGKVQQSNDSDVLVIADPEAALAMRPDVDMVPESGLWNGSSFTRNLGQQMPQALRDIEDL